MKNKMSPRLVAATLAGVMIFSAGCYGPFNLTKKLHNWNGQVGEKWTNELVFIGLMIVPAYALASWGDALIFNSIEFWTGDNPISVSDADSKTFEQGDERVVLERTRTDRGVELTAKFYEKNRLIETTRHLARPDGTHAKLAADNSVLQEVKTLADGSVVIDDLRDGTQLAFSAAEIAELAAEVR